MGWGNCGTDSKGRPIGYVFEGTCDHPGCDTKIDRGLAFACGGEHGDTECGCEGYFCSAHLVYGENAEHCTGPVCAECAKIFNEAADEEEAADEAG